MTENQKPNIENAIGKRASEGQTPTQSSLPTPIGQEKPPTRKQAEANALKIPMGLEELQRQTEERLLSADSPEEALAAFNSPQRQLIPKEHQMVKMPGLTAEDQAMIPPKMTTHVSKSAHQPATEDSTLESPKKKTHTEYECTGCGTIYGKEDALDESNKCAICGAVAARTVKLQEKLEAESTKTPTEELDLIKLRNYIFSENFTVAGVAMHIIVLCGQPLVVPATPTWAFSNNAGIPELVHATLKQPGYIEGIWPSLRVVMGTNISNETWSAGIATTIAFFDVIRVLPALNP